MRKTLAVCCAVTMLVLSGCTINTYHVMKAENNYYIIPLGNLPANDESDQADSAVTYLTSRGKNTTMIPKSPARSSPDL